MRDDVRQTALGLIESLSRGEPREREVCALARQYRARSIGELIRRLGLAPGDFEGINLSEDTILERSAEFSMTGRGFGRLRLWVNELASICMLPTYARSRVYRTAVDRSLRLLRLILDPVLVPERDHARKLVRIVLRYVLAGPPSPGPDVIAEILRTQREVNLATYRTGVPDCKWADLALIARVPKGRRLSWFVPLTVLSRDFPRTGRGIVYADGVAGERLDEEQTTLDSRVISPGGVMPARVYRIPGRDPGHLLSLRRDADGLTWARCWTRALEREHLRLAASVFCMAHNVRRARLDGEPIETTIS